MGNKIHPYGFRLGITTDWKSKWFADGQKYADFLHEDDRIREYIRERVRHAGISRIEIVRTDDRVEIGLHCARPGIAIGRRGSEADAMRDHIEKMTGRNIKLNILEVKTPELDAQCIAFNTAEQLKGRVSWRRAMRRAVQNAEKAGAQGIKVQVAGRLGGSEMSRTEWSHEGQVPLHTLRSVIDYGFDEARTTYGRIGVKVWVYKGDQLPSLEEAEAERAMQRAKAAAEGRPTDESTSRRRAARKAARAAARAAGVGKKDEPQQPQPEPAQTTASPPAQGAAEEVAEETPATPTPAQQPTADSAEQQSAPDMEQPATVDEAGKTAKDDVPEATTEQAPPQSGPMDVEDVAPDAAATDEDAVDEPEVETKEDRDEIADPETVEEGVAEKAEPAGTAEDTSEDAGSEDESGSEDQDDDEEDA